VLPTILTEQVKNKAGMVRVGKERKRKRISGGLRPELGAPLGAQSHNPEMVT